MSDLAQLEKKCRNTVACDACRARKTKCHARTGQSRCSLCVELDIECTALQPRKKRGPKNRYVEKLRADLEKPLSPAISSNRRRLGLDLIAPSNVLQQILNDWFYYIHPVAPILYRDEFMESITKSQGLSADITPLFFLLLVSVCAATIASLRRRGHLYAALTVDRCLELAEEAQIWDTRSKITLERTMAMYNFSSAVHQDYGLDAPLTWRLNGEATSGIKYLIHRELHQMPFIEQQQLKRLYWLIFAGQCTCDLHGRTVLVLRQAHEEADGLIPADISYEQMSQRETSSPAALSCDEISYVPGLNVLSRLFLVWQSSQAFSPQTIENLRLHISHVDQIMAGLLPELSLQASVNQTSEFGMTVQQVNLEVTQLHIRSNLLEQMNSLAKSLCLRVTPDVVIEERRRMIEQLLELLYRMPEAVFDANGYSIVPKIRDIGSALLDDLRTGSQSDHLQASINLDKLLAKLELLDLRPVAHSPYL